MSERGSRCQLHRRHERRGERTTTWTTRVGLGKRDATVAKKHARESLTRKRAQLFAPEALVSSRSRSRERPIDVRAVPRRLPPSEAGVDSRSAASYATRRFLLDETDRPEIHDRVQPRAREHVARFAEAKERRAKERRAREVEAMRVLLGEDDDAGRAAPPRESERRSCSVQASPARRDDDLVRQLPRTRRRKKAVRRVSWRSTTDCHARLKRATSSGPSIVHPVCNAEGERCGR